MRMTGLLGIKPQLEKKKFSSLTEGASDQDYSRFVTFEIDTSGKLESFDKWSDGIV